MQRPHTHAHAIPPLIHTHTHTRTNNNTTTTVGAAAQYGGLPGADPSYGAAAGYGAAAAAAPAAGYGAAAAAAPAAGYGAAADPTASYAAMAGLPGAAAAGYGAAAAQPSAASAGYGAAAAGYPSAAAGYPGMGMAPAAPLGPPPPGSNAATLFLDNETGGNWNNTYVVGESPPVTEADTLVKMVVTNPIGELGPVSEGLRNVVSRTAGAWVRNVYWFDAQPAPATSGAPPGSTELTLLFHNPSAVERSRQMAYLVNKDMVAGLMRATAAGGVEVVPGTVKGSYAVQPKKAGPAAGGLAGLTGGEFDKLYSQLNAPPAPPPIAPANATDMMNATVAGGPTAKAAKGAAGASARAALTVAALAAATAAAVAL